MVQLNEHARTSPDHQIADFGHRGPRPSLLALARGHRPPARSRRPGAACRGGRRGAKLAGRYDLTNGRGQRAIKSIQESTAKSMEGVERSVARIGEAAGSPKQSGAALEKKLHDRGGHRRPGQRHCLTGEQSAASEEISSPSSGQRYVPADRRSHGRGRQALSTWRTGRRSRRQSGS